MEDIKLLTSIVMLLKLTIMFYIELGKNILRCSKEQVIF